MPEKVSIRLNTWHGRGSSLDSGFHDSTSPDNSPPKMPLREMPHVVSLTIEGILKTNVAFVSDGTRKFVVKLFSWSICKTDPEESWQTELDAFAQCVSLHGIHISYLHGVCRIIHPPPRYYCLVMLTEYIGSGVTVDTLVDAACKIDHEHEREEGGLEILKASAKLAVQSMHKMRVVHADLAGRNMVVHGDQVVLVDFGCAKVGLAELALFNSYKEQDLLLLESLFAVGR